METLSALIREWWGLVGVIGFVLVAWAVVTVVHRIYYFKVNCPVCGKDFWFSRLERRREAVQGTLDKSRPKCHEVRIEKKRDHWGALIDTAVTYGCGVEITYVFMRHPFVKKCLRQIEFVNLENERVRLVLKEIAEEHAAISEAHKKL